MFTNPLTGIWFRIGNGRRSSALQSQYRKPGRNRFRPHPGRDQRTDKPRPAWRYRVVEHDMCIGHVAAVFIVVQCEVAQAGDKHPTRRKLPGKVGQNVGQGGQGIQTP